MTSYEIRMVEFLFADSIENLGYKRIYDNDLGPNTGGMGSHAPVDILSKNELRSPFSKL